eukprot:g2446.t1
MTTTIPEHSMRKLALRIIPPLTGSFLNLHDNTIGELGTDYKGDMGRIGVVGGCKEYTGAPYFAAMTALRLGADLSHVFCTANAAMIIKTYSPELIVHQLLYESTSHTEENHSKLAEKANEEVTKWFNRLDALVVGQDQLNSSCAQKILRSARISKLPLILDADSLYLITKGLVLYLNSPCYFNPEKELIEGYSEAILTPNINELRRLGNMLQLPTDDLVSENNELREFLAVEVARQLNGPIIVSKGQFDIITNGSFIVHCTEESTNRRCGGQGDVLSGSAALFAFWSKKMSYGVEEAPNLPFLFIAAYAACLVTRRAAKLTFVEEGRSMLAGDVIKRVGRVLDFE